MTDDIRELSAKLRLDYEGCSALNNGRDGDISEGDAFCDKVCASRKVLLNGIQTTNCTLNEGSMELAQC